LIGNSYACKRLEVLLKSFAECKYHLFPFLTYLTMGPAAASAYNHTLEKLDSKIAKYNDGNPIRVDGRPRASGILDTIRAAVANGVKVPAEFNDPTVIDVLVSYTTRRHIAYPEVVLIGKSRCERMVRRMYVDESL
jgi:acid phosphatase